MTGLQFKKRTPDLLADIVLRRLTLCKKVVLMAGALTTAVVPIVFGQVKATPVKGWMYLASVSPFSPPSLSKMAGDALPTVLGHGIVAQSSVVPQGSDTADTNLKQLAFDVVSIRRNQSPMGPQTTRIAFPPDGFTMTDVVLSGIVATFYGFGQDSQSGMPDWANSECYDIQAKVAESDLAAYHKLSRAQRIQMAQAILRDRFKLRVHVSQKEASIYALTIAKDGPRLKEAAAGETYTSGPPGPDGQNHGGSMFVSGVGEVTGDAVTMSEFAGSLRHSAGREVVDKTGLTGKYDLVFKWNQDQNEGPSLFTALDEQLGLKLEPSKGMVQTLVIDNIERPSAN